MYLKEYLEYILTIKTKYFWYLVFYKFIKNIEIIKISANKFQIIYGISNLDDVVFNSLDS